MKQHFPAIDSLRAWLGVGLQVAAGWVQRLRLLGMVLLASVLLSGCIQYDVGVHFASPTRGEVTQHIRVGERLRSFSDATVKQWLATIEQRTRSVGGRVERLPDQELVVKIPFSNGADLEAKFNQFFNGTHEQMTSLVPSELPQVTSQLSMARNNLLLVERNRLSYDLDLRSLGVLSTNGTVLVSPAALVELAFRLETPWGARSVTAGDSVRPAVQRSGRELVWTLTPGELNHLEAVFWMPNPLGIGTVMIVLLVLGGQTLKSRLSSQKDTTTNQSVPT